MHGQFYPIKCTGWHTILQLEVSSKNNIWSLTGIDSLLPMLYHVYGIFTLKIQSHILAKIVNQLVRMYTARLASLTLKVTWNKFSSVAIVIKLFLYLLIRGITCFFVVVWLMMHQWMILFLCIILKKSIYSKYCNYNYRTRTSPLHCYVWSVTKSSPCISIT